MHLKKNNSETQRAQNRLKVFRKNFLNNKIIPCIPSLIHESKFVTDYFLKSENLFNSHFAEQCSPNKNNSQIPLEFSPATGKSFKWRQIFRRRHFVIN